MEMELYGHLSFPDLDTWGLIAHRVYQKKHPHSPIAPNLITYGMGVV